MSRIRRLRGITLPELVTTLGIMSLVLFAAVSLLLAGTRSYRRTGVDSDITIDNAQGLRKVAERLRGAMSATLSTDGTQITYWLPKYGSAVNPVTGELELQEPLASDGVERTFRVYFKNPSLKNGTLTNRSGKILVSGIDGKDPSPKSTQQGQAYRPFQLTTIGSLRAVTINLVTRGTGRIGSQRYVRMKTTVILRNSAQ